MAADPPTTVRRPLAAYHLAADYWPPTPGSYIWPRMAAYYWPPILGRRLLAADY